VTVAAGCARVTPAYHVVHVLIVREVALAEALECPVEYATEATSKASPIYRQGLLKTNDYRYRTLMSYDIIIRCAICGGDTPKVKFRGRLQKPARMTMVLYSDKSKMEWTDIHFCRKCSLKIWQRINAMTGKEFLKSLM
jgi:hypothetical protein